MFWHRPEPAVRTAAENHPRGGALSDFILGIQDGLVNVLGVVLGVAIASQDLRIILVGGLAATFAESISMGSVAYTSTMARRDHYASELERERQEMKELPEAERAEVREILERWGFSGEELQQMLERIVSKEKAWLEIMMAHELYLAPVANAQPLKSGVLVGLSSFLGSLIPLIPFLFTANVRTGIFWSVLVSAVALFAVGFLKGNLTTGHAGRSGAQMVAIGIASAMAGFLIGFLLSPPFR